ncbi:MAG: iron-sulfur cluster assembly scaffold protein [Promethearchaeota archaeon]|nr:MAG: iron-sulfur cluster assembly scaffold protein [Candidatus Lokiarchaeota archaeon]
MEDYNEKIVNLYHNTQNWGKPSKEVITVFDERRGGPKEYFLGLYLTIENDFIIKANFITDGCGVMIAVGSQLTILIEGKSIEFAKNLKLEDIDKTLNGLPEEEKYYADFVIEVLKSIIEKYKQEQ